MFGWALLVLLLGIFATLLGNSGFPPAGYLAPALYGLGMVMLVLHMRAAQQSKDKAQRVKHPDPKRGLSSRNS